MITESEARIWKQRGRDACLKATDPLDAEAAYDAMLRAYIDANGAYADRRT